MLSNLAPQHNTQASHPRTAQAYSAPAESRIIAPIVYFSYLYTTIKQFISTPRLIQTLVPSPLCIVVRCPVFNYRKKKNHGKLHFPGGRRVTASTARGSSVPDVRDSGQCSPLKQKVKPGDAPTVDNQSCPPSMVMPMMMKKMRMLVTVLTRQTEKSLKSFSNLNQRC